MDVGVLLVFQNWHQDLSDREMFVQETELGVLAEECGFDSVWAAEHHFDDYSMCPDNLQLMSYLAGRTSRIKLGTGAVILPWNDPLRVVEKVTMLEHLAPGRVLFGMGRGLAKMEYEAFRQDMNESRGRFDEAAEMILRGLRDGYVENDGPYFPQPKAAIRPEPHPATDWTDRIFAVAMSPDSVPAVARIGARMMTFIQYSVDKHVAAIEEYRGLYRQAHNAEPPPVLTQDFVYCHEDAEEAERVARDYLSRYFLSVIFPHHQMQILPYNRVLKDLNGLTPEALLERLDGIFVITSNGEAKPARRHELGLYLNGQWHTLNFRPKFAATKDPIEKLDVTLLQRYVLAPIFGIDNPRTSPRIHFVGGIRGTAELEKLVNSRDYACAMSLFPTSIEDLMAIADAGGLMPPKSTWFEPKLRDGMFCHLL